MRSTVILGLISCALTACAALGLEQSHDVKDTVVQQYANVQGVANAGKIGADTDLISAKDGRGAQKVASAAQDFLEGAETAAAMGDTKTAEARLALAVALLEQANGYLDPRLKHKVPPPRDATDGPVKEGGS